MEKNEFNNIVKKVITSMNKECKKLTKRSIKEEEYTDFVIFCEKAKRYCSRKGLKEFAKCALLEGNHRFLNIFTILFDKILRKRYMLLALSKNKMRDFSQYMAVKNNTLLYFWNNVEGTSRPETI